MERHQVNLKLTEKSGVERGITTSAEEEGRYKTTLGKDETTGGKDPTTEKEDRR